MTGKSTHSSPKTRRKFVTVHDEMQDGYHYELVARPGQDFDPEFKPQLTPSEMLHMGVFGGKYLRDCTKEFPASWFKGAKLAKGDHADKELNYFGVWASKPLSYWKQKGWLHQDDPRGWFQWYCRYYMGRRMDDDARQIKRWKAFTRHIGQIKANCDPGDIFCRRGQRQALLHWAYDSRKM
jgi:hypothetical protein